MPGADKTAAMKLHVLSDLHLTVHGMERPHTDADVVVLAGDIARPASALEWALGFEQPVVYVPGNHEFYGSSLQAVVQELQRLCAGSHVHVLDNGALELQGVRFLGSTLWTDFRIAGAGLLQTDAMTAAQAFNRDFSRVRVGVPPADKTLTPRDTIELFGVNARWLDHELSKPYAGPTVVVTHHAPSPKSIHPRFAGSPLNASFVSDAEWLLQGKRARLWIHGHTHDSFDYEVDGTRVVCNPRGYAKEGVAENARFDPRLTLDIA
jgi:predicted phosphodiesterase